MRGESFVSKSSVCVYLHGRGMRVSSDLMRQLDESMKGMLEAAMKRAESNGRSTVRPQDL